MKAKNITSIAVIFLITAFATPEAFSQGPFKPPQPRMLNIEIMADELGLTQDQVSKIQEQRFAIRKNSIEMRSKIQISELELQKLLQAPNPEESKIKNKIEEIGKLKTGLRLMLVQGRLNIKNVLTEDQKEKLEALKKERFKNRPQQGRPFQQHRGFRHFRGDNGSFEPQDFNLRFGKSMRM